MSRIAPVTEITSHAKVAQTFERLAELFGSADAVPAPFFLYARVPAFLADFYMNFKKFCFTDGKLSAKSKALIGLAVAGNSGNQTWSDFFAARLKQLGGDDQTAADVAGLVSACALYNAFFKFRDLSGSDLFSGMAVGLRAHTFTGTSLDEQTVELINIAISDLNACKPCTEGHVAKARQLGLTDEAILETIQCAATVYSGVQFLKAAGE
jgi:lipoyl-dependent peroxiredoxin subunit D